MSITPQTFRWRIHEGQLPLRRRHLKALEKLKLPDALMGWAYERLEWVSMHMLSKDTEGVLIIKIDEQGEVSMSLGALQEVPTLDAKNLLVEDGLITGVQHDGALLPGSIWLERGNSLYISKTELVTATETLARDLAETLKISAIIEPQRVEDSKNCTIFLISDEFGYVPIAHNSQSESPLASKIAECFAKLW